jgi:hypothetical protein
MRKWPIIRSADVACTFTMDAMTTPRTPGLPPGHPLQPQPGSVAGKTAIGTLTVIGILVGLLCVLPALFCGVVGLLGQLD